jgi:hypothetical protein
MEQFNKRNVDIHEMDGVIFERCSDWLASKDALTYEAALSEYIDAILQIVSFDEANPSHRHDVVEQALATINTVVNYHGKTDSMYRNEQECAFARDQFQSRLIEKLLDQKNGNSIRSESLNVERRRDEIRSNFTKVMWVDSSIMENTASLRLPQAKETIDWNKHENVEAMIQIDCPDWQSWQALIKKMKKLVAKNKDLELSAHESEGVRSVTISPAHLNYCASDRARELMSPIENMLQSESCMKIDTLKNDHYHCLISHWSLAPQDWSI